MLAANVMSINPITVNEDTPILEVVSLLTSLKIGGLPVLDDTGVIVGIITESDLMRRSELGTEIKHPYWKEIFLSPGTLAKEYTKSHACYAKEVMTFKPLTVELNTPIDEVINLMEINNIKRVPVIDLGRLVGIITRADILKALRAILTRNREQKKRHQGVVTDESISVEISERIYNQPWAPRSRIRISVEDGTVHIYGTILDENLRSAIITLIEEVTGSQNINDHLIFIEPITGLYIEPSQ